MKITKKRLDNLKYVTLLLLLSLSIHLQYKNLYKQPPFDNNGSIDKIISDNSHKIDSLSRQVTATQKLLADLKIKQVNNYETYNHYLVSNVNSPDSIRPVIFTEKLIKMDSLWNEGYYYTR